MATLITTIDPKTIIDLAQISEGDQVGYLGCGSGGYLIEELAQKVGATGKIYAADILPEAIKAVTALSASKNLNNIQTVWTNLEIFGATDIPAHSLNSVLLITVLFQNKNKEAVLKEAERLLRDNGVVVVVEWQPGKAGFGPADDLRLSPTALTSLTGVLGYREIFSADLSDFHYLRIYKK